MNVLIGYSRVTSAENAVNEVTARFIHPKLILFFAPSRIFAEVSLVFHEKFPKCSILGATAHFSYAHDGVMENAVSAVSFEDGIECACGVINEIDRFPSKYRRRLDEAVEKIPGENTICLEFMTAFSFNEDVVVNMLNNSCDKKSIPIAGGCSGMSLDDLERYSVKAKTYVSLNGKVFENSCVFALVHNQNGKIKIFKEDIFKPTKQSFTITSVDFERHTIYTLDGIPASKALAAAYRCNVEDIPLLLRSYPFGRVVNKDCYMADIVKINDDGSFMMNAAIYNGVKMNLFAPMDYREITKQTLARINKEVPNSSFTFFVSCLVRTMFYLQEQYLNEWARLQATNLPNSIGFSSAGEQLRDRHFNQIVFAVAFE